MTEKQNLSGIALAAVSHLLWLMSVPMRTVLLLGLAVSTLLASDPDPRMTGATVLPLLPPRPGNPRNTEGSFVTLRDKRILFAYTKFTGGGGDDDAAVIVGRYSADGGRMWGSEDVPMVSNEGALNVMSVSLLRLKDGRIALFYLRKNSGNDCHPYLRFSSDEAKTWSDPILCIRDDGFFVLNNDRVVQLKSGRILMPVAWHGTTASGALGPGVSMTYLSDDSGRTWRRSATILQPPEASRAGYQEPGVVELKDGRLMMFIRTMTGSQYLSYSRDGGETWAEPKPSNLLSPLSPASIKRIPSTGDLLAVWNDHAQVDEAMRAHEGARATGGKRTPLTVAVSRDEGQNLDSPAEPS